MALKQFRYVVISYVFLGTLSNLFMYLSKKMYMYITLSTNLLRIKKIATLDIAYLESPKYQDLITITGENLHKVYSYIESFAQTFFTRLTIITAAILILKFNIYIFLIMLITFIPQMYINSKYNKDIWRIWSAKSF